ncbi:kininogen-1-like [Erythrolamprus reginae]|uniref:kininogen-1-like n=1 Tax=Erythrolamprus reginae TaxID=121349 RepID=UPI00396C5A83
MDMQVFILLVLSIGLCQGRAVVTDSNDPEIVDAVNRAIKALNDDFSHEKKFALYVVLLAHRTQSGNCTADVVISESKQFTSIVQNCRISRGLPHKQWRVPTDAALFRRTGSRGGRRPLPPSRTSSQSQVAQSRSQTDSKVIGLLPGQKNAAQSYATCPGCWHHINILSPNMLRVVEHTIRQFNNQSQQLSLFGFAEMKEAQSQVVNGVNYRFEYSIKETNCSKNEFADLRPECRALSGGLKALCKAKAYVNNRGTIISSQVECRPEAEDNVRSFAQACPGCHGPITADSQELKRPLEAVVKLFNLKSSSDFYFKIVEITKISGQALVGHVYRIDFRAQRTNCSKAEVQKPDNQCPALKDGVRHRNIED